MWSARLSTAGRGSMLALALASAALPAALLLGQAPLARVKHPGAILVQTMDTSINPLAAEIVLPAFGLGIRLSEEGVVLLLNLPDGLYLMQARHLGYRPEWRFARITGDTARIEFVLPPTDAGQGVLGGGLAEARLREFLRRSGSIQMGSFITRAEIERRRPRNLVALLARIPELRVDRAGPGPSVVRSNRATGAECRSGMLLFVDGMLPSPPPVAARLAEAPGERASLRGRRSERSMLGGSVPVADAAHWSAVTIARDLAGAELAVPAGPASARRSTSPLDWVPISLVAGVEIYPTGSDVPPEFRVAGAECGVALVWTIRR
jgi:hypothetical protein